MSFTIRQKIFLSYIVMIAFTLVVGIYAILTLGELNSITTNILFNFTASNEKLTKMNDSILAQDLYEKRFLMLRQSDAENMFFERSRDFKSYLEGLVRTGGYEKSLTEAISSGHEKYNELFTQEVTLIKSGRGKEAEEISANELKASFNAVLSSLKDLNSKIKAQQDDQITRSGAVSEKSLMITTVLSVFSLVFGILFAYLLTDHLNKAIIRLKEAADSIKSGDFDNLPDIKGADELADLALSFKQMSVRLKELGEMNLDANPLTKLPGNLAIEKELFTRLNDTQSFSFCLVDLDNFKAFNDRYSYARGSDLIEWMAQLLIRIKKEYGADDDFLGHIGGDDFILICSPERVQTICSKIIEEFDRGIIEHYDPEDAKKGFIISIDRNDKPTIFGIMTVSIAVVNTDRTLISEPKEVTQKVTELKQYAKSFAKSIYIMDRRRAR
ncbi:MAG: HAMP domain-containing protein [Nitrospiraceae bacterium]|nr:MAG: HAMP domain-containing protein [Nitrospiraceae bacterium]